MQIELKKEEITPLLSRKRATYMVDYDKATPSRLILLKEVAKKAGVDEKLVILKHIYPRFGFPRAKIIAHIYSNADDLKKFEENYLLEKHSEKKAEAAEGSDASEEKAEGKPAK